MLTLMFIVGFWPRNSHARWKLQFYVRWNWTHVRSHWRKPLAENFEIYRITGGLCWPSLISTYVVISEIKILFIVLLNGSLYQKITIMNVKHSRQKLATKATHALNLWTIDQLDVLYQNYVMKLVRIKC